MRKPSAGGGWPAIWYSWKKGREAGGVMRLYRALSTKNACKTCALGMGGQQGGMRNEAGKWPEVCKKSIQAMTADMQGAIPEQLFTDTSIAQLQTLTPRELEHLGRITHPLYAGPLDSHFRTLSWDEAMEKIAAKMRRTAPQESFFYFSGRSSNEAGFLLQLVARFYGTNNVNNCSFYCHQASGVGLASVTGSGTATIVLEDLDKTDLIFLIGGNPASNHPRFMRTLMELRRRGGKVIVVNPLRELGLTRFKVPSDVRSLLFGSRIADLYIQPHIGGDIAFLAGVAKRLLETGRIDRAFIDNATIGFAEFEESVRRLDWKAIEQASGLEREVFREVAEVYSRSQRTVFAWAMGITHHEHGVENVQAIGALAMMRGMLGKPGAGLLPLRGHSNVQGIGSIGATPQLRQAIFDSVQETFNVTLPTTPGLDTLACVEAAAAGRMRFALCLGGNLYGSNPDAAYAAKALGNIDTIVFLSTTLNTGHVLGRGRETLILPVLARDEEPHRTTQESMFSFVRLSEGGEPRHEGPRSEIDVIADLAERVLGPEAPLDWASMRESGNIRRAIAQVVPGFEAMATIDQTGREFHISGRTFHEPMFPTDSGRAVFHRITLPRQTPLPDNGLRLMTLRSEGQFNTVVYEDYDLYRGTERRDVILMNADDIRRLGFTVNQPVTIRSEAGVMTGILVREADIRAGNAAMYYPEANILVPRRSDPASRTPSFKNIAVTIER